MTQEITVASLLNRNATLLLRPSPQNVPFPIARPTHVFGKVKKKKKIRITCKEASTLVYKHTILSY